jgi:threonine synthase
MGNFTGYRCSVCGERYDPETPIYVCPSDGGNLDVLLDSEGINNQWAPELIEGIHESSIWRYLPLLPVAAPGHLGTPLHAVGMTPFYRPDRLGNELGFQNLWVKDDGRNPTASFKDRASAVVVVRAEEIGAGTIVTASTGNAGAALAGMAAAAGMPAVILAPMTAPQAKVAQLLMFGAQVFLVDGTYDDAFDLTLLAAEEFGWYCRNTGYNPFTAEGKKTAAFEICEQITHAIGKHHSGLDGATWDVPDSLFVSVGDGNIISGLHKGFKDLLDLGWIERTPRIYGVQAEGSAAIANAFQVGNETIEPVNAQTFADSISVDLPRDGLRALRAVTQTGGAYVTVSDEEILAAMKQLAQRAAVFAEPAGATSFAGLVAAKELGLVSPDERIVVLNTGNGLKDVDAAMQAVGEPVVIEPTLKALTKARLAPPGGEKDER